MASNILVIGGGANGLACAFRLAKAGARVTLVEAAEQVGGGARTVEFAPGFRASGLAHLLQGFDARAAKEMRLERHGFQTSAPLATILPGETPLTIAASGELSGAAPEVTEEWDALTARLNRHARRLAPFRQLPPPRVKGRNDWMSLAPTALGLGRAGRRDLRDLMRLLLTNAADVAEDDLSDPRLQGLLAFEATLGAWAGPRSPGTLLLELNRRAMGAPRLPKGGMGALAGAMRRAVEAAGVTLRTGTRAERLVIEGDRARGAVLSTGEVLAADQVVSALCPRTTLLGLAGAAALDTGIVRRATAMPFRGGAAKLHLAIEGDPGFGPGVDLGARIVLAPSVDHVERAFNPVKYGEATDAPVMEITCPTAHDPSLAPEGHHVLSIIAQFVPHAPKDPAAARARFLAGIKARLEEAAPGIGARIRHEELLMPSDIEARYGLTGGSWHHGDFAVERMLFLRPFHEAARYAAPLPGLWLASAGSHPGGGVTGTAGWNAAGQILRAA
ncbi:phytoene desaturase family protein [Pseudoroseicyclus sp. CXY001]|uniref:phytoene desaturase family protein n=1 Tax=Pseudoroseicyclus sp. CXY001 TaxID=3242492 RepID=UPI00358DB1E5